MVANIFGEPPASSDLLRLCHLRRVLLIAALLFTRATFPDACWATGSLLSIGWLGRMEERQRGKPNEISSKCRLQCSAAFDDMCCSADAQPR